MKYKRSILALSTAVLAGLSFKQQTEQYTSKTTHVTFTSVTDIETIEANNYKSTATINSTTGDVVFSVPMQSFEFPIALMQKHYNSKSFLNTKKYPKAKFVAKINNLSAIDFKTDGNYDAEIVGTMTIKGKTNDVTEKANITVSGDSLTVSSDLKIKLADYGVIFKKGKPSKNIAKDVSVKVEAIF